MQFQDFKKCQENKKIILKSQQRFRSEAHDVFKEKINKTALSANDDKRIQTPEGANRGKQVFFN